MRERSNGRVRGSAPSLVRPLTRRRPARPGSFRLSCSLRSLHVLVNLGPKRAELLHDLRHGRFKRHQLGAELRELRTCRLLTVPWPCHASSLPQNAISCTLEQPFKRLAKRPATAGRPPFPPALLRAGGKGGTAEDQAERAYARETRLRRRCPAEVAPLGPSGFPVASPSGGRRLVAPGLAVAPTSLGSAALPAPGKALLAMPRAAPAMIAHTRDPTGRSELPRVP